MFVHLLHRIGKIRRYLEAADVRTMARGEYGVFLEMRQPRRAKQHFDLWK